MVKPIIMTVDDEPQVLKAIAQDLQTHYQSDYRIVNASSGEDGLDAAKEFKRGMIRSRFSWWTSGCL
jgi:thioredoxin reductase (NADPH)